MANPYKGTNLVARIVMYAAPAIMGLFEAYLRISHQADDKWQFLTTSAAIGAFGLGIPLMLRASPPTPPGPLRRNASTVVRAAHAAATAEYEAKLGGYKKDGILSGVTVATSIAGFVWWFHLMALQLDKGWASALKGMLVTDPNFDLLASLGYYILMCFATELKSRGTE
jgi:hypothetical protein